MSNKDCYCRLPQQSVRNESGKRYVLNVHNYKPTDVVKAASYQYRIPTSSRSNVVLVYTADNNPQTSQPSLWVPATTSWGKRSGTTLEIS